MRLVLPREQRLPQEHFSEDTACRPDIYRSGVLFPTGHDFGRAVPSRRDVVRQDGVGGHGHHVVVRRVQLGPSQAEIAYLQIAVLVQQQVARLEVAMQDAGAVDVLEPAQQLVQEVLVVLVRQAELLAHHWVAEKGRGRGSPFALTLAEQRGLRLLSRRLLGSSRLRTPLLLLLEEEIVVGGGRRKVVDGAGQLLTGFLDLLL